MTPATWEAIWRLIDTNEGAAVTCIVLFLVAALLVCRGGEALGWWEGRHVVTDDLDVEEYRAELDRGRSA